MNLYDEFADLRDRFEVLAFHDKRATDFAMLDQKLERIVKERWGGRQLPFPILLDTTGRTVAAWGVNSWPTSHVIDPDGKVHVGWGEAQLRSALEKERAKVEGESGRKKRKAK